MLYQLPSYKCATVKDLFFSPPSTAPRDENSGKYQFPELKFFPIPRTLDGLLERLHKIEELRRKVPSLRVVSARSGTQLLCVLHRLFFELRLLGFTCFEPVCRFGVLRSRFGSQYEKRLHRRLIESTMEILRYLSLCCFDLGLIEMCRRFGAQEKRVREQFVSWEGDASFRRDCEICVGVLEARSYGAKNEWFVAKEVMGRVGELIEGLGDDALNILPSSVIRSRIPALREEIETEIAKLRGDEDAQRKPKGQACTPLVWKRFAQPDWRLQDQLIRFRDAISQWRLPFEVVETEEALEMLGLCEADGIVRSFFDRFGPLWSASGSGVWVPVEEEYGLGGYDCPSLRVLLEEEKQIVDGKLCLPAALTTENLSDLGNNNPCVECHDEEKMKCDIVPFLVMSMAGTLVYDPPRVLAALRIAIRFGLESLVAAILCLARDSDKMLFLVCLEELYESADVLSGRGSTLIAALLPAMLRARDDAEAEEEEEEEEGESQTETEDDCPENVALMKAWRFLQYVDPSVFELLLEAPKEYRTRGRRSHARVSIRPEVVSGTIVDAVEKRLYDLYQSRNASGDVRLVSLDEETSMAHLDVLLWKSRYFYNLVKAGIEETHHLVSKREIRLDGLCREELEAMLGFLYCGRFLQIEISAAAFVRLLLHCQMFEETEMLHGLQNLKIGAINPSIVTTMLAWGDLDSYNQFFIELSMTRAKTAITASPKRYRDAITNGETLIELCSRETHELEIAVALLIVARARVGLMDVEGAMSALMTVSRTCRPRMPTEIMNDFRVLHAKCDVLQGNWEDALSLLSKSVGSDSWGNGPLKETPTCSAVCSQQCRVCRCFVKILLRNAPLADWNDHFKTVEDHFTCGEKAANRCDKCKRMRVAIDYSRAIADGTVPVVATDAMSMLGTTRCRENVLLRGCVLTSSGKLEEALQEFDSAIDLGCGLIANAYRGRLRFRLGDIVGALNDLDKVCAGSLRSVPEVDDREILYTLRSCFAEPMARIVRAEIFTRLGWLDLQERELAAVDMKSLPRFLGSSFDFVCWLRASAAMKANIIWDTPCYSHSDSSSAVSFKYWDGMQSLDVPEEDCSLGRLLDSVMENKIISDVAWGCLLKWVCTRTLDTTNLSSSDLLHLLYHAETTGTDALCQLLLEALKTRVPAEVLASFCDDIGTCCFLSNPGALPRALNLIFEMQAPEVFGRKLIQRSQCKEWSDASEKLRFVQELGLVDPSEILWRELTLHQMDSCSSELVRETDTVLGFCKRGDAAFSLYSFEEALENYSKANRLDPNCSEAWQGRGLVRAARGETRGAMHDLQIAAELDPTSFTTLFELGLLARLAGRHEAALGHFERACFLAPSAEEKRSCYKAVGLCFLEMKDFSKASAEFTKSTMLDPFDAESFNGRAVASALAGSSASLTSALHYSERAISLDPSREDYRETKEMILKKLEFQTNGGSLEDLDLNLLALTRTQFRIGDPW